MSRREAVNVVRELHPWFDKPLLCKCENSDRYGVRLVDDALEALGISEPARPRKGSGHKLTGRIYCRLSDGDLAALQRCVKADGYDTMQSFLSVMIKRYLKRRDKDVS